VIELRGKILVRRATTSDGKFVLVVAGVLDSNIPIESFDPRDEMWATILQVDEKTIRFVNENNMHFSPEDFLENAGDVQNKDRWKRT
jgi:hypothetical protein